MAVLEGRNVTKTYREGKHEVPVLHGVSLSVERGEVVALEGPSGSGKTTLLCILGCLLTPTSGRIVIDGQVIDANRPERLREVRRRSIGFVFQQFNLFPSLTASENVRVRPESEGVAGAEGPPRGRPGPRGRRSGRSQGLPAPRPLGRPAPADRGGAGAGRSRAGDPRRRADRQPRLREWQDRAGLVPRAWRGPRAGRS